MGGLLAAIVSKLLGSFGLSFTEKVLTHIERRAESSLERERIRNAADMQRAAQQADIIKHSQQFRWFWIPWLMAAVPTVAWFGWGMLDSTFNGALPDVAALPPQLKAYADVVFQNIFYSGAGVAGAQAIANAMRR